MEKAETKKMPLSEILQVLRGLKDEIRRKYRAEIRGVFGSYVRGEQEAGSDLDVLVEFDPGANLLDLTGLALALEEKLNLPVDVVPESAIRDEIKETILMEKVPV